MSSVIMFPKWFGPEFFKIPPARQQTCLRYSDYQVPGGANGRVFETIKFQNTSDYIEMISTLPATQFKFRIGYFIDSATITGTTTFTTTIGYIASTTTLDWVTVGTFTATVGTAAARTLYYTTQQLVYTLDTGVIKLDYSVYGIRIATTALPTAGQINLLGLEIF